MNRLLPFLALLVATPILAQRPLGPADSALVGRILLAEDRRDSVSPALDEGKGHSDPRIQTLAKRAAARIRDPKFAGRDSFPRLPAPPVYTDPAWRLRFRDLAAKRGDCSAFHVALADSAWPVRLLAADRITPDCADPEHLKILVSWASNPPKTSARTHGGVSWHPAAHAIVALARVAPARARELMPPIVSSPIPWLRTYAARSAGALADTATLRRLARDRNDNVKEAAIDNLSRVAGHVGDGEYVAALSANGYQAVRAAARALRGSPRGAALLAPLADAWRRIAKDSSETSRDARVAIVERALELASAEHPWNAPIGGDFDCGVARAAAVLVARGVVSGARPGPMCAPMLITLPADAVSLALGREVRLKVTLADSSGGGSFVVRLRGDVAPIMAARVLALARSGYYNGLTWHRVEPDFVIQGGGRGANEYVGFPRFMRDELGTVPHVRGTVGMSTRGHDTGDGQWFVNLRDNQRLNPDYTVFAEVIDGIEVVDGVLEGDVIGRIDVLPPAR